MIHLEYKHILNLKLGDYGPYRKPKIFILPCNIFLGNMKKSESTICT